MAIVLHMLDGSVKSVTPSVASKIRDAWALKEYETDAQREFINKLASIEYSKESSYCLCRHEPFGNPIAMGHGGKLYRMKCQQCGHTYITDYKKEK